MKVIAVKDFYDLTAFVGRKAGEVIEVPEDRGAKLIAMKFAEAEKAETSKAKPATKKAAKK